MAMILEGRNTKSQHIVKQLIGALLRKEISQQFGKIITLPGASAYGFSFERKFRA